MNSPTLLKAVREAFESNKYELKGTRVEKKEDNTPKRIIKIMAKAKTEETPKNLEELQKSLNAKYGKGTIVGGTEGKKDFKTVSTGSILFDRATNCGGYPIGKLIEILGPESAGKSTITLHAIAEFQKAGHTALLCDFEHSFDSEYAATIGVDIDTLLYTQPSTMEDGYNLIYDTIKSGLVQLIVLDSHTAMVSQMRLTNDSQIGDAKIAPEARVNSDALRKIKPELDLFNCTVIGVSQLRANIGGMGEVNVGTGGNAWKFYPDMRIKIYKILDRPNELNKTNIEIIKNKCSKPFGKCEVPILWGVGFDKMGEVIDIACEMGIIKKAGSWYSHGENKIGQGKDSVKELFESNPEFYEEIRSQVLNPTQNAGE